MTSERIQRQVDRLLDEAERAVTESDWPLVLARCDQVLALDPQNPDAHAYRAAAERAKEGFGGRVSRIDSAQTSISLSLAGSPLHTVVWRRSFGRTQIQNQGWQPSMQ